MLLSPSDDGQEAAEEDADAEERDASGTHVRPSAVAAATSKRSKSDAVLPPRNPPPAPKVKLKKTAGARCIGIVDTLPCPGVHISIRTLRRLMLYSSKTEEGGQEEWEKEASGKEASLMCDWQALVDWLA